MKKIILLISLFACMESRAQECKLCGRPALVNLYDLEWSGIQKPEDKVLFEQWRKLGAVTSNIYDKLSAYFSNNGNCIFLLNSGNRKSSVFSTSLGTPAYNIYGIIYPSEKEYGLKLWIQPACSQKFLAETYISFQIYPLLDVEKLTSRAVSEFAPSLLNISGYEKRQRTETNSPLASKGEIEMVVMDRDIKPGSETEVLLKLFDCDGEAMVNKEISFEGTTGGSFTPSKVKTNKYGEATVKFKLISTKANLRSNCKLKNVRGCEVVFKGSEALATGPLVKVTMDFSELSIKKTDWKKANPFGNIQVSGGEEIESNAIYQSFAFYHKPSPEALKNGFLVFEEKTELENYGSTSNYIYSHGSASYSKRVADGSIQTSIPGIQIGEKQEGVNVFYQGDAPDRPAVIQFFTGDKQNPAYFSMVIMYPLSEEYIANSGATIIKGDTLTGSFITRKITDKKSPYKTEYILEADVDLEKEFAKGVNFSDLAGEIGYRRIKVSILSPY